MIALLTVHKSFIYLWRGDRGAGGVREMGEKRVGSGISKMSGGWREMQKGKLSLFVTAYHPIKETNPTTFLDSYLALSEARKVKNENSYLG